MRQLQMSWLMAIVLLTAVVTPSYADIYMKQKQHTDGFSMMGQTQPARDIVEEYWITPQGFRSDSPESSMIMRFDTRQMIMVDHAAKTYTSISADMTDMMSQMMGGGEQPNAEALQAMQGMMNVQVDVTDTGETTSINGWDSHRYVMTVKSMMGAMTMDIWATQDIDIDTVLYEKFRSAVSAGVGPMKAMMGDLGEQWAKIKGVQVRSTMTQQIMNQSLSSSTELIEYRDGDAPDGILEIPAGYAQRSL
ncbi:MAG: DUF4412 domain-containing protein [Gammaproteobacteria bacterium]|nr:DUF4412 domain-containing protein [Gammaproteobacteria bacterium]MDH3468178.1 DUF4412 domain-containing protein [Gammaproteobacteria bacterium]